MSTSTANPQKLSARYFGDDRSPNRYRLEVWKVAGSLIFRLFDADCPDAKGLASMTAEAETVQAAIAGLPNAAMEDFLSRQPRLKGQLAINLGSTLVKVMGGLDFDRGIPVKCMGTGQRWFASPEKLVLVG